MQQFLRPLAILSVMLSLASTLAGCTVNTYPDGSRETVWGVPQDTDGNNAQYRPGTIRDENGEVRQQTDLPER
ncbi:hypothetical protein L861_19665 [Litchfieldella anticariensis FP35 = DSM 16096]|uniref:YgdI/YgdR family lipoprotein n=1 Tax=Litchfieldella anticariensis (strain DSM 16096 / CECT 5854 / CIP 108499 / LMG 22089 / FP35) TaxID=1121939 RepID=S2LAZ9_LITA3|nr:hypothetical protein [Halomonas anticariensis]EPC01871.1 hypothetical protein L861_19665 [Halomonas anticariensis FP35 = DSM 16096]